MQIPFVDLKSQYQSLRPRILKEIEEVLEDSAFILGPRVKAFEERFAVLHGNRYALGVNSGTSALHLAFWALNLQPGDEVILPVNTFFATAEAVSLAGGTPVFVDHDPLYYNLDPNAIEAALTPRTRGIVPVHLYGQPAPMDPIMDIAKRHGLWVVEDAAQAHLARYHEQPVGSFGQITCFSFYPGKNLGAYGEAGAVLTNDTALFEKMTALRNHGGATKYRHEMIGHNYRMEGIQGAVLGIKLDYLQEWTDLRRQHAAAYNEALAHIPQIITPQTMDGVAHSWHLYVIRTPLRDALSDALRQAGIATGIHYPIPLHLQPAYAGLHPRGSFPVAEAYADTLLSLPIFPELSVRQIHYIADQISTFFKEKSNIDPPDHQVPLHTTND